MEVNFNYSLAFYLPTWLIQPSAKKISSQLWNWKKYLRRDDTESTWKCFHLLVVVLMMVFFFFWWFSCGGGVGGVGGVGVGDIEEVWKCFNKSFNWEDRVEAGVHLT